MTDRNSSSYIVTNVIPLKSAGQVNGFCFTASHRPGLRNSRFVPRLFAATRYLPANQKLPKNPRAATMQNGATMPPW